MISIDLTPYQDTTYYQNLVKKQVIYLMYAVSHSIYKCKPFNWLL